MTSVFVQRGTAYLLASGLLTGLLVARASAEPGMNGHTHRVFAAGEPGDATKPFRVIDVAMTEGDGTMAYDPASISVKVGDQVKFILLNKGALDHEFMLDSVEKNAKHSEAMKQNPEMEHDEPNGRRVNPAETSEILWRFSKTGTFEFACLIPGHSEAGMKGVVTVTAK